MGLVSRGGWKTIGSDTFPASRGVLAISVAVIKHRDPKRLTDKSLFWLMIPEGRVHNGGREGAATGGLSRAQTGQ